MVAYHPVPRAWWGEGADTLSAWLIPIGCAGVDEGGCRQCRPRDLAILGAIFIVQDSQRPYAMGKQPACSWITPAIMLLFSRSISLFSMWS